jgi:hypothetical protein
MEASTEGTAHSMPDNDSILEANLPASHRHFKGTGPGTTAREWLVRATLCRIAGHDKAGQELCEEISMDRSDHTPEQFVRYLLELADRLERSADEYGQAKQQLERILTERNLVTAETIRLLLDSSAAMMSRQQPLEAFVRAWVAFRAAGYIPSDRSAIQSEVVAHLTQILSTIADNPLAFNAVQQMVDKS